MASVSATFHMQHVRIVCAVSVDWFDKRLYFHASPIKPELSALYASTSGWPTCCIIQGVSHVIAAGEVYIYEKARYYHTCNSSLKYTCVSSCLGALITKDSSVQSCYLTRRDTPFFFFILALYPWLSQQPPCPGRTPGTAAGSVPRWSRRSLAGSRGPSVSVCTRSP